MKNKIFYFPNYKLILLDLVGLLLSYVIVIGITPTHAENPWAKYLPIIGIYAFLWFFFGYLFRRYVGRLKNRGYLKTAFNSLYCSFAAYLINLILFLYVLNGYSISVLSVFTIIAFAISFIGDTIYFAYMYALDPEEVQPVAVREHKSVITEPFILDEEACRNREHAILNLTGKKSLEYFSEFVDLRSSNTNVLSTTQLFNVEQIRPYNFDVIVNLRSLNNIRGINKMFCLINEKLPDNGIYIGCFKDKSVKKKQILDKYPKGVNWVIYTMYYIIKRLLPKLFITRHLYYDITQGKKRVLSKTEVFGRLYYCGFEVLDEKKIEYYTYFIARRKQSSPARKKRRYGPIIALNRVGKNGKVFKFYKMRTMYPYSEFLQDYIYQKCNLQEGGKFNHDIRVNTIGRIMRKFWIDELPMIINLIKGDMKLVGVRPLSNQYFNLYCDELQKMRIKFKPGLLPPFYADMPKTLDEIQASEMKYLRLCEKHGCFVTDIQYIWKIFANIVFKHARSH